MNIKLGDFYVMGILNITPDSFSDGDLKNNNLDYLEAKVRNMITQGANIIDVGGESTRPGANKITVEEEIKRVIPVIEMINKKFDVIISIDTYKTEVAKKAILAGAKIVNDVMANKYDGQMLNLIKEKDVYYVAMHNNETKVYEDDLLLCIKKYFDLLLCEAQESGCNLEKIILDPGIGFGKGYEENLYILKNLKKLKQFFPNNKFLLGSSRKKFIGTINKINDPKKRVIGTCVTSVFAVLSGFEIVRVHDIKENLEAIEMTKAIVNYDLRE